MRSLPLPTTRDNAGPDCWILAMRKFAAGRSPALPPTVSTAALPVAEQSGHAGPVTGIGVHGQQTIVDAGVAVASAPGGSSTASGSTAWRHTARWARVPGSCPGPSLGWPVRFQPWLRTSPWLLLPTPIAHSMDDPANVAAANSEPVKAPVLSTDHVVPFQRRIIA